VGRGARGAQCGPVQIAEPTKYRLRVMGGSLNFRSLASDGGA
jgi:hypothetical protein